MHHHTDFQKGFYQIILGTGVIWRRRTTGTFGFVRKYLTAILLNAFYFEHTQEKWLCVVI